MTPATGDVISMSTCTMATIETGANEIPRQARGYGIGAGEPMSPALKQLMPIHPPSGNAFSFSTNDTLSMLVLQSTSSFLSLYLKLTAR
jgi:hypothetical protein